MPTSRNLPNFEKPPVAEVVCGIQFKELRSLLAPHLGLLWERFKPEYPKCQEAPPLAQTLERFNDQPSPSIDAGFTDKPPLPRVWFLQTQGNGLIQVQRNRFLHNWRKIHPDDEYPHYDTVIEMFCERLSTFTDFINETSLGTINPLQYELTYVNHILDGEGWNSFRELGKVLPDFDWRNDAKRFLPQSQDLNWRTSFDLPEREGRLHVAARSAKRREDNLPILLFELTVRGMPRDSSRDAMWKWFDLAHEWIVCGFADLTSDYMHTNIWRRK